MSVCRRTGRTFKRKVPVVRINKEPETNILDPVTSSVQEHTSPTPGSPDKESGTRLGTSVRRPDPRTVYKSLNSRRGRTLSHTSNRSSSRSSGTRPDKKTDLHFHRPPPKGRQVLVVVSDKVRRPQHRKSVTTPETLCFYLGSRSLHVIDDRGFVPV